MKPIRCIAIDDEPLALQKLENYIKRTPSLELVALCESPIEATTLVAKGDIDAMFVDIDMPDFNGMDFVAQLTHCPLVVFTTAYSEYAAQSYQYSTVDYLLKPFDFATFQRAATRLVTAMSHTLPSDKESFVGHASAPAAASTPADNIIYLKVDYRLVKVRLDDIEYIKGMSEYVQVFVHGQRPLTTHVSMRQMLEMLPENFLQVHRSYIVNMNCVAEIERMSIVTDSGMRMSVSETYRSALTDYLNSRCPLRR